MYGLTELGIIHTAISLIAVGAAIIAFLRFDPRGLRGMWLDLRHAWVHWPLRY